MFKATPANPYDDIVAKATDEALTSENWEIILNLCDKVQDEGEQGARNVIAAILKRLAHRNPNVQLYSFTLVESLSKNCGKELHQEIASRAFTQAFERLITDRNTHDKVRNRALMLVAMWTEDFESDPTLGIMEECYESLKAKNYKFEQADEPPPAHDDDEARRREEEELQRVLELSKQDKGGRKNWNEYSLASSSGAGGSGSQAGPLASTAHQPAPATSAPSYSAAASAQQAHSTGYVPATETQTQTHTQTHAQPQTQPQTSTPTTGESSPQSSLAVPNSPTSSTGEAYAVTRVRALHSFKPTEPNELAFEKGDIIKVVDREYTDWWRGQLKGRTGIFPVNYVEPLPEPTVDELAAEARQEAAVFSQAANVDRLLTKLRTLDPAKDNLADNEEIQELYRSCMTLRPKIVKLIDKYSQKRADLISMNESFVRARTIFDRMMEESLARHSEYYEQQQRAPFPQPQPSFPPAESRVQGHAPPSYGQPADQPHYAWNPSAYDQAGFGVFPTATYAQLRQGGPVPDPRLNLGRSGSYAARQPQPHGQPVSQQVQQTPQSHAQTAYVQPYPPQDSASPPYYAQQQQAEAPLQPEQAPAPAPAQPQNQQSHPHAQQQQPHIQSQVQATPSQTSLHAQPQTQMVPHQQPQAQTQTAHASSADTPAQAPAQAQVQVQPQPQAQAQPQVQKQQQQAMTGPPFVYDPSATYPDQNVQAWAQYYAQGGDDPTGSVYFISVPGITDAHAPPAAATTVQPTEGQQPQAGSVSGAEPAVHRRQNSLPNPYGPSSPSSGENVGGAGEENVGGHGPASAGPEGPHAGARAPWQAATTLSGQFAQMRVGGEPSVGA